VKLPFYVNSTEAFCVYNDARDVLNQAYRMDETEAVNRLLSYVNFTAGVEKDIEHIATSLVKHVRAAQSERHVIEAFMLQYNLSMEEGVLMMCLAEALLRVPDKDTERLLLKDKLTSASWDKHLGESESRLVNMATSGLSLSSKILQDPAEGGHYVKNLWGKMLAKAGEPVIRLAVREAMKILSKQFVIGQTIEEALEESKKHQQQGYRFSYDMLGEVARTQADADRYYQAYLDAINRMGELSAHRHLITGPSISIKLSALHPRYEYAHRDTVVPYLIERLKSLVLQAKSYNISVTIDAEEANRLDMSLDIIRAVFLDPELKAWEGLGMAIQAFSRRTFYLLDYLIDMARTAHKRIQLRLVKGAYWDSEIKLAQVDGMPNYPVFTRKYNTDLSYLACAKKMLLAQDAIYPQFATHNAYSVAAILTLVSGRENQIEFEFQSLQGMGRALHDQIVSVDGFHLPSRIYAPVGHYQDLLPYLVRRLLENGANSSFVNQLSDPNVPIADLIESPVQRIRHYESVPHPRIPLPPYLYGARRRNSMGVDFSDVDVLFNLSKDMQKAVQKHYTCAPGLKVINEGKAVTNPADRRQIVGHSVLAEQAELEAFMAKAQAAVFAWQGLGVAKRAAILRQTADLFEQHKAELMYLAVNEAGKTLFDANAEVREAVDFLRYYAEQAEIVLADQVMPGPTGESNVLRMHGRGVVLCISPWNFPLAIFTGQVAASLVAGNTVIAKPSEQTLLIAALAVRLFYQAGLPEDALHLVPGKGSVIGDSLVSHPVVKAVIFTGSTATAQHINQVLANRPGELLPLIAETGGINAMMADSTALPEQLVRDVIVSAFGSAGQRCSALRLLCVQADIADTVLTMLRGAMQELQVGNPAYLSTDIGPVIDSGSQQKILDHIHHLEKTATLIYRCELAPDCAQGSFVPPSAFELADISELKQEIFGPVLHVVRYRADELDKTIDAINALGYGLTFGIQSRITSTVAHIQSRILAGNIYVNRNIVGAVVGVQPFGGSRLSGTGPKAGGPHYMTRLCHESTLTIDTSAVGGNASLMAMEE
jgi:RHH-type proline utilization regulon transcriptional repressor/proline dehydrogenase/delta 1-pyrroline-5-carboxylate dehydrogenase